MGRSSKVSNGVSSSYSVVRAPGFNMDLHKQQQDLILRDLNASRQKLAEENQQLRDELVEAKMIIRLLKMKLDEREDQNVKTSPANSKNSTVKLGAPLSYSKAVEKTKKKRFIFKQKSLSRKEAFLNPTPPGAKTFALRQRSLSPSQLAKKMSPRNSFSPIADNTDAHTPKNESTSFSSESRIEEISTSFAKAVIVN